MLDLLATHLPTILRLAVPFVPVLAALINKIPTRKTDPVEDRVRRVHSIFSGKTIEEIQEIGKVMRALRDESEGPAS